jgi:hypothetical protein
MATVSWNVPNDKLADFIDAMAYGQFKYQDEVPDGQNGMIPNPESKADYAHRRIYEWFKSCYDTWMKKKTEDAAVEATPPDTMPNEEA